MTMTRTESRDRQDRAADMRAQGYTLAAIASILGFSDSGAAGHAIRRSLARQGVTIERIADGTPAARRFGVEIEVIGLSISEVHAALHNANVQVHGSTAYTHRVTNGWKVVPDASVGPEVVSPILRGEDGENQVRRVMDALVAAGARIDRRCGLHVHHEVADLNGNEIASLIELYVGTQTTMDSLVAPSRRNTNWAMHFDGRLAARYASSFRSIDRSATTHTARRRDIRSHGIGGRPGARYHVLNVHCFPTYGTIEFRQHQGTLNATKAIAWIRLGQAMIANTKTHDTAALTLAGADLIRHFTNSGLPTETAAYLIDRIDSLA